MALIISGFIVFGQPFIYFYVGTEYADAYWVAVLMMVPNMIPLVQSVCLNVIFAQNKHKFRSLMYLGIAILNVVGTWILMQYMGIIGAALMTGIALIVGQGFVMNWYYHKKTGLDMIHFWKQVSTIYWVPCVMSIIALAFSRYIDFYNIFTLLAGIVVYTAIYFILNWRFTMKGYEKQLLLNLIKRGSHRQI